MKKITDRNIWVYIGLITGAAAGFFYWKFVGCSDGSCMIISNPYISTAYGAIMGGMAFSLVKKEKTKDN
jgi:outer membrane lipoprotein SlyB